MLAGGQAHLHPRGDGHRPPVDVDLHVRELVYLLIGEGVIHADEHVPAAAVDDVLHL